MWAHTHLSEAMPILAGEDGDHALLNAVELSAAIVHALACDSDDDAGESFADFIERTRQRLQAGAESSTRHIDKLHRLMPAKRNFAEAQNGDGPYGFLQRVDSC